MLQGNSFKYSEQKNYSSLSAIKPTFMHKKNILSITHYFLLSICLVVSTGCDKAFEYHPYDMKIEKKYQFLNHTHIEQIEQAQEVAQDSFKFIFMGDTQRCYHETELFVKAVNERDDIAFVIHGGDLTDYGLKKEYLWMAERLNKLKVPYVTLIGNHDVLGQGELLFQRIFGELNFTFTYNRTKFVCLNTNALEFDYSVPVPDFDFIAKTIDDSAQIDQTIVAMHTQPGNVEFNNNVKNVFHEYLKRNKHLLFCVHAHEHRLIANEIFNDGIVYYGSDNIEDRNYLLFTVYPHSYKYEVVYF